MHSQRLKTKNTRHRIALASVARTAPASSSCKRPELPPLVTATATGSSPGATDSPQLPRLPRAGGAVSSSARARCAPCLRGGDAAAAFFSRRPCSGSHPWPLAGTAPLHTGCPPRRGDPTAAQAEPSTVPGSPSPLKAGQARPASTQEPWEGEGRDGTGEALAVSVNPPTPPTLLLPPRPTKYYSSKQQGGHL